MFIKVFRPFKATINQPGDFSLWHFVSCTVPRSGDFRRDLCREIDLNLNTMYDIQQCVPTHTYTSVWAARNSAATAQSLEGEFAGIYKYIRTGPTRIMYYHYYYIGNLIYIYIYKYVYTSIPAENEWTGNIIRVLGRNCYRTKIYSGRAVHNGGGGEPFQKKK